MTLPAYAMNLSSFPEMYEQKLVDPLFRPWAEVLLQRVKLGAGARVLDLACGTGIVARLARERLRDGGRVVGVDVSQPMLAVARIIAPSIDWREGTADALPVDDNERFDVVVCQQGIQFFSDKPAAAREMRRVLAPGGRLVVATWRAVEEIPLFLELQRVAERHVGAIVDQRYSFGDAAALERLLADAGLEDVKVARMSRTIRFADGAVFAGMNAMALVGMSKTSAAMRDEDRALVLADIGNESAGVLARYTDEEGLAFEISTNVATARR